MKKFRLKLLLTIMTLIAGQNLWAQWTGDGNGTSADPYQISSYAHLKQFAAIVNAGNTSANANLVNDIVCKNDPSDPDYATDWTPIGNATNKYTGTFDGSGYTITSLSNTSNTSSNYVGLFGYVGSGGMVQYVTLEDAALVGDNYIGGIVGYSSGTVKNAVVSNSRITGQSYVGGVVGFNAGNIQTSCLIGSSSVISNDNNGGGIVGFNGNANGGIVENCYVTLSGSGSISAVGNFAGGIVGYHYRGTVANCHYSGAGPIICTSYYCGGIVGNSYDGNVHCCYYAGTGAISSSNFIGAIIGSNYNATVQNCYYNKNNTTVTNAIGDFSDTENVKGLTTAQFQDMTNFSGFDSDKWIQGVVSPLLKGMPYTITFDANGGEGGMDNQTVTSDDAAALRTNTFTRSGYHFKEWNTTADGTGIAVATDVQARLVGPETLYAQWCGNLIHHPAVEVACLDPGNSAYWECSVCHKYFSDENGENEIVENSWVIDPLGHEWVDYEIKAEPTCTDNGLTTQHCSRCPETRDIEVPATGHDLVLHAAVAAACTDAGNSAYWECETCHKYFSDVEGTTEIVEDSWVVPALGHNFVEHAAVAPTCTAAGHTAYEDCSRCDYIDGYTMIPASPATGHNFENGVCTICGHNYAQGNCGDTSNNGGANVTWSYDSSSKTLTISGDGPMMYYGSALGGDSEYHSTAPWNHLDSEIQKVIVEDDVTYIGSYAFAYCSAMTSVSLPASVVALGNYVCYTSEVTRIDIPNTTAAATLGAGGFDYCPADLQIAVPSTLLGTYQTADNWSTYAEKLVGTLSEATGFGTAFATGNYEFKRTFKCGVASTVCLPFSVTAAQTGAVGKFYSFYDIDKSDAKKWEVIMAEATNQVTTDLHANTPYLFVPYIFEGKDKGDAVECTFSGPVTSAGNAGYTGWIESGTDNEWAFQGVYYNYTWAEGNEHLGKVYGFAAKNYDGGSYTVNPGDFVRAAAGANIVPFRAFLQCNSSSSGARRRGAAENSELPSRMTVRLVNADGTVTAVGSLDTQTGEVSLGDSWYDMNGRKLNGEPSARGIYINNGKKVIKK